MTDNNRKNSQDQPLGETAEQNIDRLISSAYFPERPDDAFADALAHRMRQEALRCSRDRRLQAAAGGRRWQIGIFTGLAASVLIASAVVFHAVRDQHQATPVNIPQPLAVATGTNSLAGQRTALASAAGFLPPLLTPTGLVDAGAGDRWGASAPDVAAPGQDVRTGPHQRRRLALQDGSVLYVKENSAVRIEADRRVNLSAGQVYVEVAARRQADGPATFTVASPRGDVTALGTKFAVTVGGEATDVLVTQGKVAVSGCSQPVQAGERLVMGKGEPELSAGPRASVALDWIKDLMTAADGALVPPSEFAGGAIVARADGQDIRLALRRYHVDVFIEDGFARTTVDQTYFNHHDAPLEGTFYFPLPADASLSRLAMYVGGRLVEGGIASREKAAAAYQSQLARRHDSALLEWIDAGTFKMRLAPLEPRQEKRVILSYTQKLDSLYGRMDYRFPAASGAAQTADWSCQVRVRGGASAAWNSDWHEFTASADGKDLLLDAHEPRGHLDRDVVLHVQPLPSVAWASRPCVAWASRPCVAGPSRPCCGMGVSPMCRRAVPALLSSDTFSTSETTAEDMAKMAMPREDDQAEFRIADDGEAKYLMVRYRPALAASPEALPRRASRDWVFLVETSADRTPLLEQTQADIVRTMLENVEHGDRFCVLAAGTRAEAMLGQFLPATAANVRRAAEFLDHRRPLGALDLEKGLSAAGGLLSTAKNAYLVHIGGGLPAMGEREIDKLVGQIPAGVRYVGVGVGRRWGRNFMKTAAARTDGYFTQINPDEKVVWRAMDLLTAVDSPRLMNVQVQDAGFTAADGSTRKASFLGFADAVAQGQEVCAVARLDGASKLPAEVTISGTIAGKPYSRTFAVASEKSGGYLPRMWAKLEIDRLLAAGGAANRQAIEQISKRAFVLSPFTSLVVLENSELYRQYGIDLARRDSWAAYACPATIPVVTEPRDPLTGQEAPVEGGKPSVESVMRTILVHVGPAMFCPAADAAPTPGRDATAWELSPQGQEQLRASQSPQAKTVIGTAGSTDLGSPTAWKELDRRLFINARLAQAGVTQDINGVMQNSFVLPGGYFLLPGSVAINSNGPFPVQDISAGLAPAARSSGQIVLADYISSPAGPAGLNDVVMNSAAPAAGEISPLEQNSSLAPGMVAVSEVIGYDTLPADIRFLVTRPPNKVFPISAFLSPIKPVRTDNDAAAGGESRDAGGLSGWTNGSFIASSGMLAFGLDVGPRAGRESTPLPVDLSARVNPSIFDDLLAFAPGMNTSPADIQAALEAEARSCQAPSVGRIDPDARKLIDAARKAPWRELSIPASPGRGGMTIAFDGSGRCSYTRQLESGLTERVLCDGATLWNLYPELGVGASRSVSRFHRSQFVRQMPWVVEPAEDLARGADLIAVDDRTVAIVAPGRWPQQILPPGEAEFPPVPAGDRWATELRLVFGPGGDLQQRQVVRGGRIICRQVYSPDGTISLFDSHGLATQTWAWSLRPAGEADFRIDASLVIVPMPLRSEAPQALAAARERISRLRSELSPSLGEGFLAKVRQFQDEFKRWDSPRTFGDLDERRRAEFDATLAVLPKLPELMRRALLAMLVNFTDEQSCRKLDEAWESLGYDEHIYRLRYENARRLLAAGRWAPAQKRLAALELWATSRGAAGPMDATFYRAFHSPADGGLGHARWVELMRQSVDNLLAGGAWAEAAGLAQRCDRQGEPAVMEYVISRSTAGADAAGRNRVLRLAGEAMARSGQYARAEFLIAPLLDSPQYADDLGLWRLALDVATHLDRPAMILPCQDKVLELEFDSVAMAQDASEVRSRYAELMKRFDAYADASAAMGAGVGADLARRVARAADRWRALDGDGSAACLSAAGVLRKVGRNDLAWDYATTPLAERADSAGWSGLAQSLRAGGAADLAERADAEAKRASR